jgi:hypothetical protein
MRCARNSAAPPGSHPIPPAANFRRSKLRHLLSDQGIMSCDSVKGSSSGARECAAPGGDHGAASHLRRVLRITTEISRLESILAGVDHYCRNSRRESGVTKTNIGASATLSSGAQDLLHLELALQSPPRTSALVPKQGRATAVGPPTCGHNGSPATPTKRHFPDFATIAARASQ